MYDWENMNVEDKKTRILIDKKGSLATKFPTIYRKLKEKCAKMPKGSKIDELEIDPSNLLFRYTIICPRLGYAISNNPYIREPERNENVRKENE